MTAKHLLLAFGLISVPTLGYAQSQPLIVLEYPNASQSGTLSDNPFVMDENYSTKHRVQSGETLSHVMSKHYAGSGLNSRFVEMAIVQKNKHAFVRGNKNFLYADKTLHLPSINEIKALIMGQSNDQPKAVSNSNQIYFFGS